MSIAGRVRQHPRPAAPARPSPEVEAAIRAHLERVGATRVRIRFASDLEAGFQDVARRAQRRTARVWRPSARYDYSSRDRRWYGLSDPPPEPPSPSVVEIDREITRAAHASAFHRRNPSRPFWVSAARAPQPVLVSELAHDAARDVDDLAAPRPSWGSFADLGTVPEWRPDRRSPLADARARVHAAEPLVEAYIGGVFAFWALARRWRTVECVAVLRPAVRTAERPTRWGTRELLHDWERPAVQWPAGAAYWYWEGIRVSREIVEHPERLTARYIARARNVERRRVLLERLGYERFLESAYAVLLHQDEYGKLWRTNLRLDGEAVAVVEVVNATTEPDGTRRRYFLRVPPATRTAREAVAWTFGFERADDYAVAVES